MFLTIISTPTTPPTCNVITTLHTREIGALVLVSTLQRHNAMMCPISNAQANLISRNAVMEPPPHLVSVLVLIHPLTGKTVLVIIVAGTLVVTIAKSMEIGVILKPTQTKHAVHGKSCICCSLLENTFWLTRTLLYFEQWWRRPWRNQRERG